MKEPEPITPEVEKELMKIPTLPPREPWRGDGKTHSENCEQTRSSEIINERARLRHQARRVRNYFNPEEVFEAIPLHFLDDDHENFSSDAGQASEQDVKHIMVTANDPYGNELLLRAVKWIERLCERKSSIPHFFDNDTDPCPLAKDIMKYLSHRPTPATDDTKRLDWLTRVDESPSSNELAQRIDAINKEGKEHGIRWLVLAVPYPATEKPTLREAIDAAMRKDK